LRKASLLVVLLVFAAGSVSAVPVLQIGAPAGPGDTGIYADYHLFLTSPTEEDTALTSGNLILVAGAYVSPNVLYLGGAYAGQDWGDVFDDLAVFSNRGAILMAAVPVGTTGDLQITIEGNTLSAFAFSTTNIFKPHHHGAGNLHDPVKDSVSDFYYFDIGTFMKEVPIPDFVDETIGASLGEIKEVTLAVTNYPWVHFDVYALQHADNGPILVKFNPPSHDVTWKGILLVPADEHDEEEAATPEPASLALVALGLTAMSLRRRKRL
jgi:hypothetical protein